jgi:hypothetical protein
MSQFVCVRVCECECVRMCMSVCVFDLTEYGVSDIVL